jgi:hypothetical protein
VSATFDIVVVPGAQRVIGGYRQCKQMATYMQAESKSNVQSKQAGETQEMELHCIKHMEAHTCDTVNMPMQNTMEMGVV